MTGAPPPSGTRNHTSLDPESDRARTMFRESVRTWAPGWITAFYLFLWIGLCFQRLLYRWNGLGISVHQLPGRGRNAQLRDMVAWMDYSWYHGKGICWATDTVGAHAAAIIIAPFDAGYLAFRRARSACLAAYDAGHWWFIWTVQLYAPAFHRALWFTANYLVLLMTRTWHDPAAVPLLAYTFVSACARYTLRGCIRTTVVAALTVWHVFLPWTLRASAAAPRAVSAVLAFAHSTPSAFRHATCFIAYGFGCATGIATQYISRASSQTGVVTDRLGHALAARALIGKRRRPKSACIRLHRLEDICGRVPHPCHSRQRMHVALSPRGEGLDQRQTVHG